MSFGQGTQWAGNVALGGLNPEGMAEDRRAACKHWPQPFKHHIEDRRDASHDMDIAEDEPRRVGQRVVNQHRPIRNPRHPQPGLVQLAAGGGVVSFQDRPGVGPHVYSHAERCGNAVGGDIVVGGADSAGGKQIINPATHLVHRRNDSAMVVRHDANLDQPDAHPGHHAGQMVAIGLAGPARKDFIADHQHCGGWPGLVSRHCLLHPYVFPATLASGTMPGNVRSMKFTAPLVPGRLVRRYKRFLADIELADGEIVTAHCANPGAMLGLNMPGLKVWVEPNNDPKKKLNCGWRLVEFGDHWVGIDTAIPNKVVGEALRERHIPALAAYSEIRPEVRYGTNSRIDFLLTGSGLPDAYVEVKNVHLMRGPGLAEFPDSVTKRGAKHLDELSAVAASGLRAVMLYCVQRTDCDRLALAADLDPEYAAAFTRARGAGVEAMAWTCAISVDEITLDRPISIEQ